MLCRTVSVKDRRREKEKFFFSQIVVLSVDAPGGRDVCRRRERSSLLGRRVFRVCVCHRRGEVFLAVVSSVAARGLATRGWTLPGSQAPAAEVRESLFVMWGELGVYCN